MSHGVLKETTIENVIEIAAPAEKVFDFVVDVRNEPQWNPQMLQAEMLTPEPIGAGTRFRVRFGRGVGEALIEDIRVSRPRSWAAISQSRALDVLSEGQIDETSDGSRLVMRMRLHPRGTLRLLTPVLGVFMHRTMDQDLRRVKARLEPDPSTAVQAAPMGDTFVERVPVPDLCSLRAETETAPMNIALIGVVEESPLTGPDGAIDLDRIRSFIEARLAPSAPAAAHPATHSARPGHPSLDRRISLQRQRARRLGSGRPAADD
ncbi:MAG TPA: SRPBCC family protein [Propionibacteriaceae bacterium]|nr:SRPBCC family protein [Propionibacteriaceae bacterium]